MGRQVVCGAAIYYAEGWFPASPAPSPCSSQPPVVYHPIFRLGQGALGAACVDSSQPAVRKASVTSVPPPSMTEKGKSQRSEQRTAPGGSRGTALPVSSPVEMVVGSTSSSVAGGKRAKPPVHTLMLNSASPAEGEEVWLAFLQVNPTSRCKSSGRLQHTLSWRGCCHAPQSPRAEGPDRDTWEAGRGAGSKGAAKYMWARVSNPCSLLRAQLTRPSPQYCCLPPPCVWLQPEASQLRG